MPKYECLNCQGVFYGWGSSDQCPNCGGELREVYSDNKKSLKVEAYHKGGFLYPP